RRSPDPRPRSAHLVSSPPGYADRSSRSDVEAPSAPLGIEGVVLRPVRVEREILAVALPVVHRHLAMRTPVARRRSAPQLSGDRDKTTVDLAVLTQESNLVGLKVNTLGVDLAPHVRLIRPARRVQQRGVVHEAGGSLERQHHGNRWSRIRRPGLNAILSNKDR